MSDAPEIESKFAVAGFEAVLDALAAAGGERRSRCFEENVVLDTPEGALRAKNMLLRLRRDGAGRVTFKLPAADPGDPSIKIRREIETEVADLSALEAIFVQLGYAPCLRYEKVRETWRLGPVLVCCDELPFGRFVEIEGPPGEIAVAAETLGLSMVEATSKTYHELHQDHLAARGLPPADSFVFPADLRRSLLTGLSKA
ncbi:class IV adenylate cyclase [Solidesulfovibrio sp.]|uniref:class IV adenylate cyclase n=1 Tax=Solidesulfovibrio sp. TaxID=2910990 RepID=UPI00262D33ED|nr:class IV adenylate cyclase [Solidesulfovibrio sp.]